MSGEFFTFDQAERLVKSFESIAESHARLAEGAGAVSSDLESIGRALALVAGASDRLVDVYARIASAQEDLALGRRAVCPECGEMKHLRAHPIDESVRICEECYVDMNEGSEPDQLEEMLGLQINRAAEAISRAREIASDLTEGDAFDALGRASQALVEASGRHLPDGDGDHD